MKSNPNKVELILEFPNVLVKNTTNPSSNLRKSLKNAGLFISEVKEEKKLVRNNLTKSTSVGRYYLKSEIHAEEMNPWDQAHRSIAALNTFGAFAEPDLAHKQIVNNRKLSNNPNSKALSFSDDSVDADWPPKSNIIWHLEDDFSQLSSARKRVANTTDFIPCIAHLDTGYTNHSIIPTSIRNNTFQKNFVEGENQNSALDKLVDGTLKMPGHGTGTLGLLAGRNLNIDTDNGIFNDHLGSAPDAEVICCRISSTVVLFKTSAFAQALNYITDLHLSGHTIHVVSMSMGGAPSKAWTDAVNRAYMSGITLVCAAGNHFNGLPTRHLVFPARYNRVIAACGVTQHFDPYLTKKLGEMQGCYGPDKFMNTALAAFTPNVPWASEKSGRVKLSGAGTSSATPQIAGTAALYSAFHQDKLSQITTPWKKVEAVRNALFSSAVHSSKYSEADNFTYFGQGILQANAALDVPVKLNTVMSPEDSTPWFPILYTIFKSKNAPKESALEMMQIELNQLLYFHPELNAIIDFQKDDISKISKRKWKQLREAVINHPETSETLKNRLIQFPFK
ncbi:MAG: S8/S53 family peptidase [Saprospiraceae bacterium]